MTRPLRCALKTCGRTIEAKEPRIQAKWMAESMPQGIAGGTRSVGSWHPDCWFAMVLAADVTKVRTTQ